MTTEVSLTETILEQSERPDGIIMQTVRLSDGTEIVREAPNEDSTRMARIESAVKRAGWSQDEMGRWIHPERPNSLVFDALTIWEACELPMAESEG